MKKIDPNSYITRFLSAQTISLLGSSIVQYAIIWHITLTTSSGQMLTISTLCGFLPQIAISLFAGVWIDRYDRKMMIILSDAVIALSTLILAFTFMTGYRELWLLFTALAIRSAATGIQTPAVNAIIPQITPQNRLMKINGINSTLTSMTIFLSPVISGAILSFASLEATLFIDVATAIIGIGITSTIYIKPNERSGKDIRSVFADIKGGFNYLRKNRLVKHLLLYQLIILFLISPSAFLTPLMVFRTFGNEIWRLSASEMTYSLGMIIGSAFIAFHGGFKNKMNTTILSGAIYGALMIALGLSPAFLIYLIANTMIGITAPCYNTPITVTIQESVPAAMHGRIFSLMQIATSCALPLGMIVFGPLADSVSIQWLLICCGATVLLISGTVRGVRYL